MTDDRLFPDVPRLPAPPDGFATAWSRGAGARRRKLHALAGGGAAAAGVSLAVVLAMAVSGSGPQVLGPADPEPSATASEVSPGPSASTEVTATPTPGTADPTSEPDPSGTAGPASGPEQTEGPPSTTGGDRPGDGSTAAGPSSGPVERFYYGRRSNDGKGAGAGQGVCGGITGRPTGTRSDWCGDAAASTVEAGLLLELDTTPQSDNVEGRLSFTTDHEAEFEVYDAEGDLVWRWSAQAPAARPDVHELVCESAATYEWQTTWDRRGADGARVAPGDYRLRAWVTASEQGEPHAHEATFTLE